MCGFAGVITRGKNFKTENVLHSIPSIRHRGPDASGYWFNQNNSVGLAHTRLAIIDPGNQSDQPMLFLDRYTIVYNGEIYNFRELSRNICEKEGFYFSTGSDTEVLVACYHFYREKCLDIIEGMFSFSIWDEDEQVLFSARDRFGEKPFYYFYDKDHAFIFSNETRAIHSIGVEKNIYHPLLLHYLTVGVTNLPGDPTSTFYSGIKKLKPAHYLKYNIISGELKEVCYWICPQNISNISFIQAQEEFEFKLTESVKQRMYADTTIGCSLSGGLDSSSIVYLLHKAGMNPKSFSAIFPQEEINEQQYIESIQAQLQLSSSFITPKPEELVSDLDTMIYFHNHPIANPSSFAQYKVYQESGRQGVKVLLDGQGADEILAGYSKYNHWIVQEKLKKFGTLKAYSFLNELRKNHQQVEFDFKNIVSTFFPKWTRTALKKKYFNQINQCHFIEPGYIRNNLNPKDIHKPVVRNLNDILYYDTFNFGLDELLRYADLNSMAHGVEVRLPFLSRELVEFAFTLPSEFKINKGFSKWILRKTMENKLHSNITWRKRKIGFEVPVAKWLDHAAIQDEMKKGISILVSNGIIKNDNIQNINQIQQWRLLVAGKLLKN